MAGRKIGEAFVAVEAQTDPNFGKQVEKGVVGPAAKAGEKAGKATGSSFTSGLLKATAALGAGAAVVSFFKGSIDEGIEAQKVGAQTAAVLKSTGNIAGISAKQIGDLAGAISAKTGIDDEAIQSNENLLLTFTNIKNAVGKGNDVFNQATQAVTDMSAALGQDGKSSAIQLGKALNDPIKGVTALSRVGVSFTDQQKKQIATLVKSHDVLGAQKIILGEVQKEFGGSAAAIATPGEKMKVAWGNLQETVGTALLPTLAKLETWATAMIPKALKIGTAIVQWAKHSSNLKTALNVVVATLKVLFGVLGNVWGVVKVVIGYIADHQTAFKAIAIGILAIVGAFKLWKLAMEAWAIVGKAVAAVQLAIDVAMDANPIGLIVLAIIGLVAAFAYLWTHSEAFRKFWIGIWDAIKGAVMAAIDWVKKNWPLLLAILTGPIGLAVLWIIKHWDLIVATFKAIPGAIKAIAVHMWDSVVNAATDLVVWIAKKELAIINGVKALPGKIANAAKGMWDGIKNAFKSAINWIINKWNDLHFTIPGVNTHIPGVGTIGGFTLNTPNIPTLASGGIVKARPGGTLALLGEGGLDEAVVPLRSGDVPAGGTRIENQNIYVRAYSERFSLRQVQDELAMHGVS